MFVQVMSGRVADPEGLHGQLDRWMEELRPTAHGFLGTTAGVTGDGGAIAVVRFESADDARSNSERDEQGRWWADTARCFDGDVTFADSEDVETFLAGGSDDAGFVQVMIGTADRDRMRAVDESFAAHLPMLRPDLVGGMRVWTAPQEFVEVAYFTSEEAARHGESGEIPAELADTMGEYQELMAGARYLDLPEPWIY